MKIQQVKINFVRLPLEEPLVGAPPMSGMLREFFTVQVLTDDGIEGIGITTFGGKLAFPGRHDDQVDALTQGLAWGRNRRGEVSTSFVSGMI